MAQLVDEGILFVTSAGNDGTELERTNDYFNVYPAGFHSVFQLTVGAGNCQGDLSPFSNYGGMVDIIAPGEDLYMPVPFGFVSTGYDFNSGTSFAAPILAGIAGALGSHQDTFNNQAIACAILTSSIDIGLDVVSGGWVNAAAALDSLLAGTLSCSAGWSEEIEERSKKEAFTEVETGSQSFRVFPNPTNEQFSISVYSEYIENADIQLINTDGKVMQKMEVVLERGNNQFTYGFIENLPNGVYILQLHTPNGNVDTQKLVKL